MQAFLRDMTNKAPHIIELDQLELGQHEYDFVLDDAWFKDLEKSEVLGGEARVHAVLEVRKSGYALDMQVSGTVQVVCDRCLQPMDYEVSVTDHMDSADEDSLAMDDRHADLPWLAYELIAINLPLVLRHPEGACDPEMVALLQQHLCSSTTEEPEDER